MTSTGLALAISLLLSLAAGLVAAPAASADPASAAPTNPAPTNAAPNSAAPNNPASAGTEEEKKKKVPRPTYPGDDVDIPRLMYRFRHTELPPHEVSYLRTVGAFPFVHNGIKMVAVGPSIPIKGNGTTTALIDVYRKNPKTGDWYLVDLAGQPLTVNGKLVDWKTSSVPTYTWELAKETDPTVADKLPGGFHAEELISLFLRLKVHGANTSTRTALVEQIPCGRGCLKNLKEEKVWFPNLDIRDVLYLFVPPSPTSRYVSSPAFKADGVEEWIAAGMPTNHQDFVKAMGYDREEMETPGSPPATGAAETTLGPGTNPGGIDFTTLQLRYLSQAPGGKLQYAFSASPAAPSIHNVGQGRLAAVQASDAFFVWLSMPESSFWVNLNPNQPNRIVNPQLGTTDVGRILLQADLRMKKLTGKLIYPKTSLGRKFWGTDMSHACIDMREWILPAPAQVYEHNGGLSIIKAPLEVKSESTLLKDQGEKADCRKPDTRMEKVFETLVVPKVEQAVNHAPEFAQLRRVYFSRVAAEWYRRQHGRDGTLRSLIDSGDVSAWPAIKPWSPQKVYRQYLYSYRHKEFNVKQRITKGHHIYERIYSFGGVDFSKVVLHQATDATIKHDHPDLTTTEQHSLQEPTTDHQGTIWLGAVGHPYIAGQSDPTGDSHPNAASGNTAVLLVLTGAVVSVGLIVGLIIAATRTHGRQRRLLITTMIILLAISMISSAVTLGHTVSGSAPTARSSSRPPSPPDNHGPSRPPNPAPTRATLKPPSHTPSSTRPTPKAPKSTTYGSWTLPRRGPRPSMPMFTATWNKSDKTELQRLDHLTFSFSIPADYICEGEDYGTSYLVSCQPGFRKSDPYVRIFTGTCGCTSQQVAKSMDAEFQSKTAYQRLLPVDQHTRASDNRNGHPKYQYLMSRLYATGNHRLDHHVDIYAQARTKAQDLQIRKIIGDIYDATR